MLQHETQLQTHTPDRVAPLATLVSVYSQELAERRSKLEHDLAYYRGKLAELERLDPLDFTGLKRLYTTHVEQTSYLLDLIDTPVEIDA